MLTEEQVRAAVIGATYGDVKEETYSPASGSGICLDYSPQDLQIIYGSLTDVEKRELDRLILNSPPRALMPHQHVPLGDNRWWEVMLLIGGRGVGKR